MAFWRRLVCFASIYWSLKRQIVGASFLVRLVSIPLALPQLLSSDASGKILAVHLSEPQYYRTLFQITSLLQDTLFFHLYRTVQFSFADGFSNGRRWLLGCHEQLKQLTKDNISNVKGLTVLLTVAAG